MRGGATETETSTSTGESQVSPPMEHGAARHGTLYHDVESPSVTDNSEEARAVKAQGRGGEGDHEEVTEECTDETEENASSAGKVVQLSEEGLRQTLESRRADA